MKILVYGAGVLGCNLARNLLRAGKDVTLLARGNWAAEIRRNGLRIKDKFSFCIRYRPGLCEPAGRARKNGQDCDFP